VWIAQQVERLLARLVEVVAVWERQPAAGLGIDIGRQRISVHRGLSHKSLCSMMPKHGRLTARCLGACHEHRHPHVERRVPQVEAVAPNTAPDVRIYQRLQDVTSAVIHRPDCAHVISRGPATPLMVSP